MTRETIRVLVVDDHTVVRKGLCALLSSPRYNIAVIGEASDGAEAVTQAQALRPDMILMDLLMPIKNGVEALQDIRTDDPDAKVLIKTYAGQHFLWMVSAPGADSRQVVLREPQMDRTLARLNLLPPDRARLHRRIAARFDAMLAAGLVAELAALRHRYRLSPDLPSMRCVGYRQAWAFLDGAIDAPALREQGIAATRQLAKRQYTWLRALPATAFDAEAGDLVDAVAALLLREGIRAG